MPAPKERFPQSFGPFTLLDLLGAGGMGKAYLACHPDVDSLLVVKRMHAELAEEQTNFQRFVHEAQAATLVRHPNLASIMAVGTVGREPFFATEYVMGLQLSRIVREIEKGTVERMPVGVALYVAADLLSGLQAIHEAVDPDDGTPLALVHRDIGSRNLLLGLDGVLKIIDLGLGKSILSEWQTAADVVAGSPDYMPPEQAVGEIVDARADIYAAAVVIWELLAGRKRITGNSVAERLARAVQATPEPICDERPEVPVEIERALFSAMSPEVETRARSSKALLEELRAGLDGLEATPHRRDVVKWLASSAAPLIDELQISVAEAESRRPETSAATLEGTQIFAANPVIFVPPPEAQRREQSHFGDPVPGEDEATIPQVQAVQSSEAISDWWRRALRSDPRILYAGALVLSLVVVFVLFASLRGSGPGAPVVEPLETTAGSELRDAGHQPAHPVIAHLDAAVVDSGSAPREVQPPPPPRPVSSKAVRAGRRRLARRISKLRRARFEMSWQRKLTRLGARLSRAHSESDIEQVEREVEKLERAQRGTE